MVQSIGSVIKEWLKANNLEEKVQEQSIPAHWAEIVGESLARHAKVERVDKGKMFLRVESAAWRTEVVLRREEIRAKVNDRLGAEVVKEIVVR